MKKEYWSPILNMIAMLLIILSRQLDDGFDWLSIIASVIFLFSAISLFKEIKKSK